MTSRRPNGRAKIRSDSGLFSIIMNNSANEAFARGQSLQSLGKAKAQEAKSRQHSCLSEEPNDKKRATWQHQGSSKEYEDDIKDAFRVALAKQPDIQYVLLSDKDHKLLSEQKQFINNFWATCQGQGEALNDKILSEFVQADNLQLDFGFILSSNGSAPNAQMELLIKSYHLKFNLPCVVFIEITLNNSVETLKKKIVQLIKNRVVFKFYPSVFIGDAEAYCPETFEKVSKYKDHHTYMIVVSNYEITSGIENFNLAYFELIKDARLLSLIKKLSHSALCRFTGSNSQEIASLMQARLEREVHINHLSIPSIHSENYNNLKLYMDSKFRGMDSKFQGMDSKFQELDGKFQKMEEQIRTILDILTNKGTLSSPCDPIVKSPSMNQAQLSSRKALLKDSCPASIRNNEERAFHQTAGEEWHLAQNRSKDDVQCLSLRDSNLGERILPVVNEGEDIDPDSMDAFCKGCRTF